MADQSLAVRIDGLNEMVNDLRNFGQKEVAKEIGKVNRKFAMTVRDKVRQKIKQQPDTPDINAYCQPINADEDSRWYK